MVSQIYFKMVELHYLNRVMRLFDHKQYILFYINTSDILPPLLVGIKIIITTD